MVALDLEGFMTNQLTPSHVPASATPESDGVLVGTGPIQVDAFIDLLCPFCKRFELAAGRAISKLLAEVRISIAYHPMAFLDEASTTRYSTRAAAATGCAADEGKFMEYLHTLYTHQPREGGAGLSDAQLIELAAEAGIAGGFPVCVSAGRYLDWPSYVTELAVAAGVSATPTVLVDRVPVSPDPRAITAAVERVEATR
jgi:protein-disulfide isomerase